MNRAENIYEFRRINMHGTKTGAHADPDYDEKYHPGKGGSSEKEKSGSSKKTPFGLVDGKHKVKIRSPKDFDPYLSYDRPGGWIDVYVNPTDAEMKRLSDPEATWDIEMRFMVHRKTGDLVAWEANQAFHTQITDSLMGMPAWAANNSGEVDLWSDYTLPAGEFYDALENLEGMGEFDQPHWSDDPDDKVVRPKILRGRKK